MRRIHLWALGVIVLLTACAGGTTGGARISGNTITAEDLLPYQQYSVREAIQRLKPEWLRARTASGPSAGTSRRTGEPNVRIDGLDREFRDLELVQASNTESIQYVEPMDATTRYGADYMYGVIEVRTKG